MKQYKISGIIVLMFLTIELSAQRIHFLYGLNFPFLYGKEYNGANDRAITIGQYAAIDLSFDLSEKINIETGFQFIQKGSRTIINMDFETNNIPFNHLYEYKTKVSYFEIPLWLNLKINNTQHRHSIFLGPSVGVPLMGKYKSHYRISSENTVLEETYDNGNMNVWNDENLNKFECSFNIGYCGSLGLANGILTYFVIYQSGITNLRKNFEPFGLLNSGIRAGFGYNIPTNLFSK